MIKNHIIYGNAACGWEFDVEKAEGSVITTKNKHKLIDFSSGWNVTNLGWHHPEITETLRKHIEKNSYACMWSSTDIQTTYATNLVESLPVGLDTICRATGGTEGNEEAIKLARAYTGRSKILGFKNTYHGQSIATLSIGLLDNDAKEIGPLVPDFVHLDFPKIYKANKNNEIILKEFSEQLETILSKQDIAGMVVEAGMITGWGSCYTAPPGFLTKVREITRKYGTMMILDEVGTGFSRTGKLFGMNHENIIPDMVTFAKAITNGTMPMGAMVTHRYIAEEVHDKCTLISTFGWSPLACAVANQVLLIHKRDRVWEQATETSIYLMNILKQKLTNHPLISDIRGMGLEIGIDFNQDQRFNNKHPELITYIMDTCKKYGLHIIGDPSMNMIQLMPSLIIQRNILDQGLDIMFYSINEVVKKL